MSHIYTILYLDDEIDNLISFKAVFRRYYNIFTAQNASEAYVILEDHSIDLIISDQRMPGLTGVDFFEKIRERYPKIIRVLLTGYSDMQAIIDAINKGKVYYYATKPWQFDALKVILNNALEAYSLREMNESLTIQNHMLNIQKLAQEKEQMIAKYELLKNQINPHFLFNCLNTLASIIETDQTEAVNFTTKFAHLYRNILEFGDQPLITLGKEVHFMEEYLYLQNIRFGSNVQISINIPRLDYLIPPFSLQILLENVIKHNIISSSYPMEVQIDQYSDKLIVKNPIRPKPSLEHSTKIGLENLNQRYQLLTGQQIKIENDGMHFVVHLPIIPKSE